MDLEWIVGACLCRTDVGDFVPGEPAHAGAAAPRTSQAQDTTCCVILKQSHALGAQALRLVADDRDAYVYYRVGEELDLDLDFSDPEKTCDLACRLDLIACGLNAAGRANFSAALPFLA